MWHTHADLERIRTSVLGGKEPWASAYRNFSADKYSQADYAMQGPKSVISRGSVSNYSTFAADARAAWQNALMWYITKDESHGTRSTTILDAWGSNLTNIIGTDRSLMIGLDGDMFANAAEIMRHEGNWTENGAVWQGGTGFSTQLYWLFSRQSIPVGQANYGMVSIKAMLNFAVFLDDVALWNYAVNELVNNPCAGVYAQYNANTGQSVESGRDQGKLALALQHPSILTRYQDTHNPASAGQPMHFALFNPKAPIFTLSALIFSSKPQNTPPSSTSTTPFLTILLGTVAKLSWSRGHGRVSVRTSSASQVLSPFGITCTISMLRREGCRRRGRQRRRKPKDSRDQGGRQA